MRPRLSAQRDLLVKWVTKNTCCKRCGGRLAFASNASSQVGCCASWQFCCEKDCKLPLLDTSRRRFGNDFVLNAKVNVGLVLCAMSFERAVEMLAFLGMAAMSKRDHYACKVELEPILGDAAEVSMAEAHARNVKAGNTDFVSLDGGYTGPRNAHGCTMAAHAADGGIVAVAHKRLSDPDAKSSQGLEALCFLALCSQFRFLVYTTVVMDGCTSLVAKARDNGKRVMGDIWMDF